MVQFKKKNNLGCSKLTTYIIKAVSSKLPSMGRYVDTTAAETRARSFSHGLLNNNNNLSIFMMTILIVSIIMNKIALITYNDDAGTINFGLIESYIWLPSLFLSDILYIACIICFSKYVPTIPSTTKNKRFAALIWITVLSITSIVALVLSSIEIKSLVSRGEAVSWGMTFLMLDDWASWKVIIMDKAHKGVPVWIVSLYQIFIAVIVTRIFLKYRNTIELKIVGQLPLLFIDSSVGENTLQKAKKGKRILSYGVLYSLLVIRMRPTIPYQSLSSTLMISVPVAIMNGAYDTLSSKSVIFKNRTTSSEGIMEEGDSNEHPHNLNVVLLLLETMRGDMFPFDPTTPWAKRKIPEAKVLVNGTENKVTPFYANWVKKPSTLHIPHIRGAAGVTHKAIWSIFCSAYAKPVTSTVEHLSNRYHECLPHLLEKSGHGYKKHQFFKSITSHFDHQFELAQNMGFESMYGEREYNLEYTPNKEFIKSHRANYFGYEDDIILKPVMKWIDTQANANKTEPFLFSYLSGATHDPYDSPPKVSWEKKSFVKDSNINNFLNEVSYTDRFLSKLMGKFEQRGLMNNTLFVIVGDHGINFKNRDETTYSTYKQFTEESFDVGVSFYTENKEVSEVLTNVKNSDIIKDGNWSTLDIVPTILDLLNYYAGHNNTLLNGKYDNSIVDGRSMLHPPGKRLQFAIANPGDGMVLRDGFYVILVPSLKSQFSLIKLYDLEKDPNQEHPIFMGGESKSDALIHWARQAVKFVKKVELDLILSHQTGQRCNNCALSLLNSLESLDQWSEYEHLPNANVRENITTKQ